MLAGVPAGHRRPKTATITEKGFEKRSACFAEQYSLSCTPEDSTVAVCAERRALNRCVPFRNSTTNSRAISPVCLTSIRLQYPATTSTPPRRSTKREHKLCKFSCHLTPCWARIEQEHWRSQGFHYHSNAKHRCTIREHAVIQLHQTCFAT